MVALTGHERSARAQQPPPHNLTGFPDYPTDRVSHWHRAHRARPDQDDLGCWWFASRSGGEEPGGRFDLCDPDGTCYVAESEGAAARERVGRFLAYGAPIPPELFHGAVVARVRLPETVGAVADTACVDAARFGVTAELGSGHSNYAVCVQWADALHRARYDGIRYARRFTPGGAETALALFDECGARPEYGVVGYRPLANVLRDLGYRMARSRLPSSAEVPVDDAAEPDGVE